jgi:hypothetical protein
MREPKIISVKAIQADHSFKVTITAHMARKLPDWVQSKVQLFEGEDRHAWTVLRAKDELEAVIRFKRLWAALTKIGD